MRIDLSNPLKTLLPPSGAKGRPTAPTALPSSLPGTVGGTIPVMFSAGDAKPVCMAVNSVPRPGDSVLFNEQYYQVHKVIHMTIREGKVLVMLPHVLATLET